MVAFIIFIVIFGSITFGLWIIFAAKILKGIIKAGIVWDVGMLGFFRKAEVRSRYYKIWRDAFPWGIAFIISGILMLGIFFLLQLLGVFPSVV